MKPNATQRVIDRLVSAADTGRLTRRLLEDLDGEPFIQFDEWSESLREVADAIDQARNALDAWDNEEGREARADAKDHALDAIQELVDVWQASPLDLVKFESWVPSE